MCYIHCTTRYKNHCILSRDEEAIQCKPAYSQMGRCRFTGRVYLWEAHCMMNLGTPVSGNRTEVSAVANCNSCNNLNQWNKLFCLNYSPLISARHKGWFTLMHSATDQAISGHFHIDKDSALVWLLETTLYLCSAVVIGRFIWHSTVLVWLSTERETFLVIIQSSNIPQTIKEKTGNKPTALL